MRILIADDHRLFQKGLSLLLQQLYPDSEVAAAPDADRALELLAAGPPFDLLLVDLAMPGMTGVCDVRRFVEQAGQAPVVVLSAHCEAPTVVRAIECGASGYILKSASDEVFKNAVSLVLSGETYVPSVVISMVNRSADPLPDFMAHLEEQNPLRSLTQRQRDTLALVMDGLSNKEIARHLGLLESTVKAHVKVILHKLKAANRTQAAMIATDLGLPRTPLADK